MNASEEEVVHTAASLFLNDVENVSGYRPAMLPDEIASIKGNVVVGTAGNSQAIGQLEKQGLIDLTALEGQWESFLLKTVSWQGKKTVIVAGSDSRGTAYGILELSRLIGVSPWYYFADVPVVKKKRVSLPDLDQTQVPSVPYRGIFINDEDWGMMPWASMTYDPEAGEGVISPKAHERIFELMIRLRANTFWPAMHGCTVPFYAVSGNREMADKYGIFIGTSHCEPMSCNVNGEWRLRGEGDYNYVTNKAGVQKFLEERVKETANSNNIYTLGMRGIHDGAMDGAKSVEEQKNVIVEVLADQREMLRKWRKEPLESVPQVFIPYKEVLDIYNAGLEVPEEVTLMWCDDNYGYIRHFPTPEERARKGGNGVYYHVSYWGRPHDYLWLATTHPALVYQQMKTAYEKGIQKMWILNVGDIKPAEYLTELFLDMAWNIEGVTETGVNKHLENWLSAIFGSELSAGITEAMREYYRLAYIRKPEYMGNTRVEESDPAYKVVRDLPWSEKEIRERLEQYEQMAQQVHELAANIPADQYDSWFQLVAYPLLAANEMNKKHLYAQLARHNRADAALSQAAYDSIQALTHTYNHLNNGKWNRMMDAQPRNLPVFKEVSQAESVPVAGNRRPLALFNGMDYHSQTGEVSWAQGLGYEEKSAILAKGSSVTYEFEAENRESISVEVRLLPNHPVSGRLRFRIEADGCTPVSVDYRTQGRSEEWKQNVLRNQAIRTLILPLQTSSSTHCLTITALDEGVVLDQVIVEDCN